MAVTVRDYSPGDEQGWLRCRALAFLDTSYFDDVVKAKPSYDGPTVELVADSAGSVAGLVDVAIADDLATIETIAVHPDAARRGIGSVLLGEVCSRLPVSVGVVDAWTRDDEAANKWYLANGFRESFRYLHVYASNDSEVTAAIPEARPDLAPVAAFFHADISDEEAMRNAFDRVHVCRRYIRSLPPGDRS